MSKCRKCGNDLVLCVCPKGLGSGGKESKDSAKDKAYVDTVSLVANALLKQYADINEKHPSRLSEFIDTLREILDDESAQNLLQSLEDGIATKTARASFLEKFQNLGPNMAMLDALSHTFALDILPSPANQFVVGIQQALQKLEAWPPYPAFTGASFQEALSSYAAYYQKLSPKKKTMLSDIFWGQIQALGTPIIESNPEQPSECNVYFLQRKDNLAPSNEVPGTRKDLYLQGDFHGYESTDGRQLVEEFEHTGIMLHKNTMPKDAMIAYRYIQLEPSLWGRKPQEHYGSRVIEELPASFFSEKEDKTPSPRNIPAKTKNTQIEFWGKENQVLDTNSRHRRPYPGSEKIFRVNPDPDKAAIAEGREWWSELQSTTGSAQEPPNFLYHDTLYSDVQGKLQHCAGELKPDASPDDLFLSQSPDSPYANLTRIIHVFKPSSEVIEQLIVLNDGMPYLSAGALQHFEKMVEDGKISANTALIFVTPLPGLAKTMTVHDPKFNMQGMGPRTIEYGHGRVNYTNFLGQELFPGLKRDGLELPDSENRIMIGSSLSGTFAIYVALTEPTLFGAVIAQSPSPSNRTILKDAIKTDPSPAKPKATIHLSCGVFEEPAFAANTNLPFATELSSRLDLPLHKGLHGHQFLGWTEDFEQSVPETMDKLQTAKMSVLKPS